MFIEMFIEMFIDRNQCSQPCPFMGERTAVSLLSELGMV